MTRLFRNPDIKVGDKVRIHAEPLQPVGKLLGMPPNPEEVGLAVVVTAVNTYEHDTSLDYDADYHLADGSYNSCDCQFLEIVGNNVNIQEIFNRVIDRGYYDTSHTDSAMCSALYSAWYQGVVSYEEYLFAGNQIKEYLLPAYGAYLFTALKKVGLPHTIEARTAIYRDWANRPTLTTSTI